MTFHPYYKTIGLYYLHSYLTFTIYTVTWLLLFMSRTYWHYSHYLLYDFLQEDKINFGQMADNDYD